MKEIWKDIENYEGIYQVSNLGRVKTLGHFVNFIQTNQYNKIGIETKKYIKERIHKMRYTKNGYARVQLNNKDFFVHRLVAATFIRQLKEKEEVNHIDGNKLNNSLNNLEIVSRTENQNHAYYSGLNLTIKPSCKIKVNGIIYVSLGEAERKTGISKEVLFKHLKNPNIKPYKHNFSIKKVED